MKNFLVEVITKPNNLNLTTIKLNEMYNKGIFRPF